MLSNEHRFVKISLVLVKIRVVFHTLYFENEVRDPPMFLHY